MNSPITAGELIEMLQLTNDAGTHVKINGQLLTDYHYHELTGVSLS